MVGERSGEPLMLGAAVPISAFSPLGFTFRLIERELRRVILPLFLAGFVATLDWLIAAFVTTAYQQLIVIALWWPISSYCNAGMLSFVLRVARREPHQPREVWKLHGASGGIALLKLLTYGLAAGALFGAAWAAERLSARSGALSVGFILVVFLVGVVVASRIAVAPVVLVDRRVNPLRALYDSVQLTRGHGLPITIYFIVLSMIAGFTQTFAGFAVLATLATPGMVYLYLALRGELAE
jgi:hypothetical protein